MTAGKGTLMKRTVAALSLFLLLLLPLAGLSQDLEVHFINVGQGDAILIKTPENKAILIDAGIHFAPGDVYSPFGYLKTHGVNRLDAIFITHPHDDHYKGFEYLCMKNGEKEYPVGNVYYSVENGPGYGKFQTCLNEIIARSEEHGQVSARGPPLDFGDVKFTILYPKEPITLPSKNKNLDSIVMKVTYKNVSFMFTGDSEKEVEKRLDQDLKATVLKVGHHGSSTSTGKPFLELVAPELAVISCNDQDGKGKRYGHPHAPTLNTLKDHHVILHRTDLSGNIVMQTDGDKITVSMDTDVPQDSEKLWEPGKKAK